MYIILYQITAPDSNNLQLMLASPIIIISFEKKELIYRLKRTKTTRV